MQGILKQTLIGRKIKGNYQTNENKKPRIGGTL